MSARPRRPLCRWCSWRADVANFVGAASSWRWCPLAGHSPYTHFGRAPGRGWVWAVAPSLAVDDAGISWLLHFGIQPLHIYCPRCCCTREWAMLSCRHCFCQTLIGICGCWSVAILLWSPKKVNLNISSFEYSRLSEWLMNFSSCSKKRF
jgi:hypothetical protein